MKFLKIIFPVLMCFNFSFALFHPPIRIPQSYERFLIEMNRFNYNLSDNARLDIYQEIAYLMTDRSFIESNSLERENMRSLLSNYLLLELDNQNGISLKNITTFLSNTPQAEIPYICYFITQSLFETITNSNVLHYPPAYFIANQSGECDEASLFFYFIFSEFNITCYLIDMELSTPVTNNNGYVAARHTACVYQNESGNWNAIDNYRLYPISATNYAQAIRDFIPYIEGARLINPTPRTLNICLETLEIWDARPEVYYFYLKNRSPQYIETPLLDWFYINPLTEKELISQVIIEGTATLSND